MGKNWRGGSGGGRGGGGRGGRGGGRGGGGSNNDTSSCKGHGAIIGTCDAARERETSKEMVNLLNQAIEIMCPTSTTEDEYPEPESTSYGGGSVKDMLAQEIAQVRKQRHTATQNVMSVDTKVKGLVLIKIMRKDLCPVDLVKTIFDRVRKEREPCSRHVVRLIPLQRVFYPNNNDLSDKVASIIQGVFPGAVLPFFEKEIEEVQEASNANETTEDGPVIAAELEQNILHATDDSNEEQQNKRPRTEPPTSSSSLSIPLELAESSLQILSSDEIMPTSSEVDLSDICEQQALNSKKDEAPLNPSLMSVEEEPCATTLENESCQVVHELTNASGDIAPATFYPPLFYSALFKARSHNLMTRESVQATIAKTVPTFFKPNYKRAKVHFLFVITN